MLRYYLHISLTLLLYTLRITSAEEKCSKNKELPAHLKIKEHILCDYDQTIRPVINNNATPLEIKFLVHHFDLTYSNELEVDAWFGMRWTDEHIHWDPDQYNGVETIILTTADIWHPDLYIDNRGRYGSSKIISEDAECLLMYHKKVICIAQTQIRGMCTPDFRFYPFDVQNCTLRIGSWFHSGQEIDLIDTEIISEMGAYSQFALNPEWKMEELSHVKDPGHSESNPNETFPSLKFHFVIRRNANAKFVMFILPILVLIGIAILTLWLDPMSSDRIYILTVNIPAHVIFMLNTEWDVPHAGDSIPYILQLMRDSELIVVFTLVETIIVRYFLNKTKESPRILVNMFTTFANNKIGQLLLFSELNPENAAGNLTADDSSNLVEVAERPKEWYLLGRVIDRLFFVASTLFYVVMFCLCYPKK